MFEDFNKLFFIVIKNFKIVFRSWAAIFLLIIGPLILIMLVTLAYSNPQLQDMVIGVHFERQEDLSKLTSSLDHLGEFREYTQFSDCIEDLKHQKNQVCLDVTYLESEKIGEFDPVKINVAYDNSKRMLSYAIIGNIGSTFGIVSEQITLASTESILGKIEEVVVFMGESQESIDNMVKKANQQKQELLLLKSELLTIQSSFLEKYEQIKKLQEVINSDQANDYLDEGELNNRINEIINDLNKVPPGTSPNVDSAKQKLYDLRAAANNFDDIHELRDQFNSMILGLDVVKTYFDTAVGKIDTAIKEIDLNINEINKVSDELKKTQDNFAGIDKGKARSLLNPISVNFSPLLINISNIQIMFPFILLLILSFISIIFSNICVLEETHSNAYFRNFIAPISDKMFLLGLFISSSIISFLQISILLIFAQLKLGISLSSNLFSIVVICLFLITIYSLVGMIIGLFITSSETSLLVCTFCLIGTFILSDTLLPLEVMSKFIASLLKYSPLIIGQSLLQQSLFYYIHVFENLFNLSILLLWIIALVIVILIAKNINKNKISKG